MDRRAFLEMLAVACAAGMPIASKSVLAAEPDKAGAALYDLPAFGNVGLLHFTDCHAQLTPIRYREPSINLGVGAARGRAPHLVGESLLKAFDIAPGSAMAHGKEFFARALATCRQLGLRAVFVTPFAEQLPAALPDTILPTPYVPFDLLLPRLAALVHHGGIGTTAQALASGAPQLITPFAHDQFDNAARVVKLGAGEQRAPTAPARRWAAALDRLTNDPTVARACRRWQWAMGDHATALESIADSIESLGSMR